MNFSISALMDSGSDLSLINCTTYVKIGTPKLSEGTEFTGVGKNVMITLGKFDTVILVDGELYNVSFHVVPDNLIVPHCVILGSQLFQEAKVTFHNKEVKVVKVEPNPMSSIFLINESSNEESEVDVGSQDQSVKLQVLSLVKDYRAEKLKEAKVEMKIILSDDTPVYQRPRRLSPQEKNAVDVQIKSWLEEGIIQPSTSDYASPVVLVRKKNGDMRLCVDFRALNKKIIKERYPLPLIEDQIDSLQGAKCYSTLDLRNGFFHIPVSKDSQKFTSFVVPNGQYEFLRVPFGLCNSPAVFQRYVNTIFKDLIAQGVVLAYMDDLIIPSDNEDEGIARLTSVLNRASCYGLEINWGKCRFLHHRIEYLGHIIEDGKVKPSKSKTEAVLNFPTPKNVKAVQSFLGLTGYFRKFIESYSTIARPLSDLLKDQTFFVFGPEQDEAFRRLKIILSSGPVLKLYRLGADTELHTDASSMGYGAILLQKDTEDGKFHPIYYSSSKTTPAEQKYCSYELEVLAIVKALRRFRVYLLGIPFRIVTDCRAFELTLRKRDLCVRVARWALLLEEFNYSIEHRPGKSMKHVDCLSRTSVPQVMLSADERSGMIPRLKRAQCEDIELGKIFEKPDHFKDYTINCGLLYKEIDGEQLLVVPRSMQVEIIKAAHGRGHFSVAKTVDILKREHYFPKMENRVKKVIASCIDCILAERKTGKQEGFLHPIDKGDTPLHTYHVDHVGPLTPTRKGYCYMFVVVDAFCKFVWLYPTKSTGASEVISNLSKQAAIFGNPRRIISDRGSAFMSHVFEDYCETQGIQHLKVTTGLPRANGQVERVNRLLIPLLSKLSKGSELWYKYVQVAQQFINSTPSRSTKSSPFELLIGTRMKLKEDSEIRELIEREVELMFQEKRDELRQKAIENIRRIQEENKRNYDKKRKKATEYKAGDLVAIKRTQPASKLKSRFLGPYQVVRPTGNDRYEVKKVGEDEGPRLTTTAADLIKPWIPDVDDYLTAMSDQGSEDETHPDHRVEKIGLIPPQLTSAPKEGAFDGLVVPISSRTRTKSGRPNVGGRPHRCPAC